MKALVRSLLPRPILDAYHKAWALGGATLYSHPSTQLVVIGVTGTKGKSTTTELVATLLRGAGHKVAVASTIHFVVGDTEERNLFKMTMPGRAYVQKFLRRAVDAGCTHAVVEMSSEGAKQFRHLGIELNALIFTNLAPEHLESHGSMENYVDAKLSLARAVAASSKRPRIIVTNTDDTYGQRFLDVDADIKAPYALKDASAHTVDDKSLRFVWRETLFTVPLPGLFNLYNCLAALTLGEALGLDRTSMQKALEHVAPIAGRAERVVHGQPFDVVVDYAHTMESLRALYETFKGKRIIAVIGAAGGGRDAAKRAERGALAEQYAALTFVANEDPYDEDPQKILHEIAAGFTHKKPQLFLDRRAAIREAIKAAKPGDAVLLTGKGTDPYIMGAHGSKEPWSEYNVAAEELGKLGYTK